MTINKEVLGVGIIGSGVSGIGSTISMDQLDRILSISCSILGIVITIVVAIIIPLFRWWKKAKADGKITKEELEEGKNILQQGIESVKNAQDKNKKED